MWAFERTMYQIYPLGMCGAPLYNDGVLAHRILKVLDFIPHLKKMNIGTVYFSPIFESDRHGYDTRDYRKIDIRLGTNEDFQTVCQELHKNDIKVIIDGVFNHVGRGFFAFKDVLENRGKSRYKEWFNINFCGNNGFNDGIWYEGWEGIDDLVKLNLRNSAVTDYLLGSVKQWIEEFDIDGLRLDVAYMVDQDFLALLRYNTSQWKEDFFLLGEILSGDYRVIMNDKMCHSATNYECFKGIYSSLNSHNLFEIIHSLLRQFGPQDWTLYKGLHPVSFVDNHDVTRIASNLFDERLLPIAYTIAFAMPGIPMVYYGSEWGIKGRKEDGDSALRPDVNAPIENELTAHIASLSRTFNTTKELQYGTFDSILLENEHCIFERRIGDSRILCAINMTGDQYTAHFDAQAGRAKDLITDEIIDFGEGLKIPPYTGYILKPF